MISLRKYDRNHLRAVENKNKKKSTKSSQKKTIETGEDPGGGPFPSVDFGLAVPSSGSGRRRARTCAGFQMEFRRNRRPPRGPTCFTANLLMSSCSVSIYGHKMPSKKNFHQLALDRVQTKFAGSINQISNAFPVSTIVRVFHFGLIH